MTANLTVLLSSSLLIFSFILFKKSFNDNIKVIIREIIIANLANHNTTKTHKK
jgi:hypothetical protein